MMNDQERMYQEWLRQVKAVEPTQGNPELFVSSLMKEIRQKERPLIPRYLSLTTWLSSCAAACLLSLFFFQQVEWKTIPEVRTDTILPTSVWKNKEDIKREKRQHIRALYAGKIKV